MDTARRVDGDLSHVPLHDSAAATPDLDKRASNLADLCVGAASQDLAYIHHDGDMDLEAQNAASVQQGRTLLPFPLAQAVTLTTRSASLALRIGTSVGGYTFKTTKAATLSSFDLGRFMVEGILSRAGKDLIGATRSQYGRAEAENLVESGMGKIHRAITNAAFFTATGFQIIETSASYSHDLTQHLLSFVDQLLGSTESSRAIASIITLIRREFQNPATGVEGEKVGILDLLIGILGLVYLQRHCREMIEAETRKLEVEEVVWDVVVATSGERYNLHYDSIHKGPRGSRPHNNHDDLQAGMENGPNSAVLSAIQSQSAQQSSDEDDDLPEVHLRNQILCSLPEDARVKIMTETTTSKTITVDISGASLPTLSLPPGAQLIEQGPAKPARLSEPASHRRQDAAALDSSSYRYVYRVDRNSFRTTDIHSGGGSDAEMEYEHLGFVEQIADSSTEDGTDEEFLELPPPVPPKNDTDTWKSSQFGSLGITSPTPTASIHQSTSVAKASAPESANQKRQRTPLKPPSDQMSSTKPPAQKRSRFGKLEQSAGALSKQSSPEREKTGGIRASLRMGTTSGPPSSLVRKESSETETCAPPILPWKSKTAPVSPISPAITSFTPLVPSGSPKLPQPSASHVVSVPGRTSSMIPSLVPKRDAPPPPSKGKGGSSSKSSGSSGVKPPPMRSLQGTSDGGSSRGGPRASYFAMHERKRDSLVSQSDTYSIHTLDSNRPISPSLLRTDAGGSLGITGARGAQDGGSGGSSSGGMSKSRSERDISENNPYRTSYFGPTGSSSTRNHRRSRSQNPSICTLKTSDSQTSLVLASYYSRSAYSDTDALSGLRSTGMVPGMFPAGHLLRNISRYMLFSSASYGSNFLKVMGISKKMSMLQVLDDNRHHELTSYAHHTESEAESILLSSFVDPQGGSDSTGSTNTGVPLVHYVSIDKEAKAVVLACRGTLGFEDVLADMTCDYDDLLWRGRSYKVHKGIHASARRLLYGGDGRVLVTLKAALEEFPDYGLVLCGHSLGGAVTALLGVMLSEPNVLPTGPTFVTSACSLQSTDLSERTTHDLRLPAGRPIHVFAYGPPGTMSASLRKATRGLITSVVQGNDLVPHLSLGVLHDMQAVALAIKNDNIEAKMEVRQRCWAAFQNGLARSWYSHVGVGGAGGGGGGDDDDGDDAGGNGRVGGMGGLNDVGGGGGGSGGMGSGKGSSGGEDDTWAFAALKTLRANMMSMKLLPPGEVFTVESTRVYRRDAFVDCCPQGAVDAEATTGFYVGGKPARRVVLKYIKDVEHRFREVVFAKSMLTDHSPGRYEDALRLLKEGVMPRGV